MTSQHSYDAGELSQELAERIEDVVAALRIDVKKRTARKLNCFAPWNLHHKAKLEVQLYPIPGKWNDWVDCIYGDAFDLVARTLGGGTRDRQAAYRWALDFLGLRVERDPEEWERRRKITAARAAARLAKYERELAQKRRQAFARWLAAAPLAPGQFGWAYLAARGIDLAELPRGPKGQHLVRAVRYQEVEGWYDDELQTVTHVGPCLMSAMTFDDGTFASLHRTWLNPERPGEKADLDPPRKMWPASDGAAIRLWRGSTRASAGDAVKRGIKEPVRITEGVEDGLSVVLLDPEMRTDAAGSLAGLGSYVPSPCASELIICADNDWNKPQAEEQLERACARFHGEFKLPVRIARSPEGKDFNDLLRGAVS